MQQAIQHKAAQVMAAVWTAGHLDCVTSAQPHKQLNYMMNWVDWDQHQTLRVKPSKLLAASQWFLLQVPKPQAEVSLNFATCFVLTLAKHAFMAASDAASSKDSELSRFLQELQIKQSMSEAQLCS